jgi:hypothetical protein
METLLLGLPFVVKTDQQSLKFLLDQKIGTLFQHKWITKLLGYDFVVDYKKGVENRVADVLSRKDGWEEGLSLSLLSIPIANWVEDLKQQYTEDEGLKQLMEKWLNHDFGHTQVLTSRWTLTLQAQDSIRRVPCTQRPGATICA